MMGVITGIFGGVLLFLIALEMVFARTSGTRTSSPEEEEGRKRTDISVFPLAFPFIAGPGAMATILLSFGPAAGNPLLYGGLMLCVAIVLLITLAILYLASPIMRIMGVTGANVLNRLFGVVLGALSVQFVGAEWRAAVAFVILVAVLLLRPQGLFGRAA